MRYIIHEHSFIGRFYIAAKEFAYKIMNDLKWTFEKFDKEFNNVHKHIYAINDEYSEENLCHDPKIKYGKWFSEDEWRLIAAVYKYDKKRWSDRAKDYFPCYMSDYEIQKAIKESYSTAGIVGSNGRSQILYEGKSNAGLRVRFIFNANEKQIVIAYPVYAEKFNLPKEFYNQK